MKKSERKACPFCAGKCQQVQRVRYIGMRDGFQILCSTCGSAGGEGADKFEAWQEWNTRAGGSNQERPKPKGVITSTPCGGSAASWWVYYFDEGKNHYISAIPLEKKQAQKLAAAAQKYYHGRQIAQITETPPNADSAAAND